MPGAAAVVAPVERVPNIVSSMTLGTAVCLLQLLCVCCNCCNAAVVAPVEGVPNIGVLHAVVTCENGAQLCDFETRQDKLGR